MTLLRETVLLVVIVALAPSTSGCAAKQQTTASAERTRAPSDTEVRTHAQEAQQAVMVFVDRFIPALAEQRHCID